MSQAPSLQVLLVEDDPDVRLGCEQALQLEDIAVSSADSAEKARRRLTPDFPGIVADFGGNLTGDNHPDGGAVFTLDLPAAAAALPGAHP
jgi:hypothetical protein